MWPIEPTSTTISYRLELELEHEHVAGWIWNLGFGCGVAHGVAGIQGGE
jgi:hypothetical protein